MSVQRCPECFAAPIACAPDIGRLTCGDHFWSVRPEWPDLPSFRDFAASIADAVLWAESQSYQVVPADHIAAADADFDCCCCPLGALVCMGSTGTDPIGVPYPTSFQNDAKPSRAFMHGFEDDVEGLKLDEKDVNERRQWLPHYQLGRAYRERALAGKAAA